MNEAELSEWNRWFTKFVEPVFNFSERENYYDKLKKIQAPFYPKYWIAERFYDKIKDDNRFDDELKKYFSFLYSCGFFMEYIISYEEWLNMSNWETPYDIGAKSESILEILKKNNGVVELKTKLRWLPFINRQDGF